MGQSSSTTTANAPASAPIPNVQAGLVANQNTTPVPFMQAPFTNGSPVFGLPPNQQQTPNLWQMQFAANPQQPNNRKQGFQVQNSPLFFANGQPQPASQDNQMMIHHLPKQQQFQFMPQMPATPQAPPPQQQQQPAAQQPAASETKQTSKKSSNTEKATEQQQSQPQAQAQQQQQTQQAPPPQPPQQQAPQAAQQPGNFFQMSQQKFAQPIDLALPTPPKSFTPQFRPQIKGQQNLASAGMPQQAQPFPYQQQQQGAFNNQLFNGPNVYGAPPPPQQQQQQQQQPPLDYARMYPYGTCNQVYGFQNANNFPMPQQITQF